ncbi:3-isopropylmalate dehydrogenase [Acaricomes phytoseiuli]|uniref:3-isopropylmalate dehydrogenase n=1 Tax=Acaricomes phytoseiuli TaxID=291968 RepID=UPI002222C955|nr:3-isopropylmalate dehydrogenase [Acaricomes phytoseiuli]MCW1250462.1 3-isopropylmalate dehydrogenase [Acaricomes phytoseiuli]
MNGAPASIDLAVIPGDGIGPEVITEALKVLRAALAPSGVRIQPTEYALGAQHWLETGETLNPETLEAIRGHDAILFGAVGAAPGDDRVPSGLIERELLLKLRFSLDHYINLRPARLFPGVLSPLATTDPIDFVVVREGTEGPYAGTGGSLRAGTEAEVANEVSVNTAFGVRRVVRDAFQRAASRKGEGKQRLTYVHKHNVLVHSGRLWRRIVEEAAADFPEVAVDYLHVDAASMFLVTDPGRFEVIVTDNLFGDILTDLAAAVTGGIGLAASGNLTMSGGSPSMFEPVHGSAPDIAGQQKADPTAAILSAAMLLEHLGHYDQAARIEAAVADDLARRDGARSTAEVGDAIAGLLS